MLMRTRNGLLLLCFMFAMCAAPAVIAQQGEQLINGTIDNNTAYVEFSFTVEQDDSTIVLDIVPVSGDLDTLLYLVDSNGIIVDENDDRSRTDYSSRIEFPHADAGAYTAIATRYGVGDGSSSGDFQMIVDVSAGEAITDFSYSVSPSDLSAAGFPEVGPNEEADWTILAYYGGDTDLEAGLINDFNEFELSGGSTEQVRILVLLDRTPEFTDTSGNWDTVRIFEVQADVSADHQIVFPPTLDSVLLAELGELNTGDGQTLAQFLVWGVRNYPAQNYAIAFGGHGSGWEGLIPDDTSDQIILSVPELALASELATVEAGVEKFNLLINDACLMSSVEYYAGLQFYFDYSLASPEVVIDPAIDMTLMTERIKQSPGSVDIAALGSELVDKYINQDSGSSGTADAVYFTHSITDLNKFSPVAEAVEQFAAVVNEGPIKHSSALGLARSNSYTYTHFIGSTTRIDLGSFMRQVLVTSRDDELIAAANNVLSVIDSALVYSNGGERVANRISYYNIYFPQDSSYFRSSYFDESPLTEWGLMLRNYYNAVTPQIWTGGGGGVAFHRPLAPRAAITGMYPADASSVVLPTAMSAEIVGRNISHADFTVDQVQPDGTAVRLSAERILVDRVVDGELQRVNEWHGVDTLLPTWDVTQPFVTDGATSGFEFLVFTEDVASLDGYYAEPGGDTWHEVSVIFDREGVVQRVISKSGEALAVVDIPVGSTFVAFRSVISPDGRVTVELGTYYEWIEGGLTWSWQPVPSGEYNLGFLVTAFGGTTGFASISTSVNNDGVPADLRGDTRLDFGFTMPRPSDWDRIAFFDAEFYARSNSPDKTANNTLYLAYPGVSIESLSDDIEVFATEAFGFYGLNLDSGFASTEVDGQPVSEFAFSYETEQGVFNGRAFAYRNNALGLGAIFAREMLEGTGDLDASYQRMKDNFTFFDAAAFSNSVTNEWVFRPRTFNPAYEYPIMKTWLTSGGATIGGIEDGIWARYSPSADADRPTFTAMAVIETPGTDAAGLRDSLVNEYALANGDGFEVVETRAYGGGRELWEVTVYTIIRNGQPIMGRMYATVVGETAYAIWMETPNDDGAASIFAYWLEPTVDGFVVND
jgi:hypothetical protein